MLKCVIKFVLKLLLPDALTIFPGACWIACLNYKTLNISMKNTSLVVVRGTESEKILTSERKVKKIKNEHKTELIYSL